MKILIIEDMLEHFEILKRHILASEVLSDPVLFHAPSLRDGVNVIKNEKINLIFLDLSLPDSNSLDSLIEIKNIDDEIPVIVVTSHGIEDLGTQALRKGAIDFVCKEDIDAKHIRVVIKYALERQQIRDDLVKAKLLAEKAASVRTAFLANMSHEIRTPLNLIIGTADLLKETQLTPQQRKLVHTFSKAGDHLLMLIDNILDVSRIEAKGLNCIEESFDLNEVGFEVSELMGVLCRQKKIDFDYLISNHGSTHLIGDKTRIKQIMLNLLNNAVKFTEKGSIKLELVSQPLENQKIAVEITITDSGKGVTEHEKKQLFNAFFQAESGLTRSFKGTGLGLSIVKAIVDHYHGEIDIQSSPHVGTKIKVSLALSADQKEYEKPSVLLDCNVLAMVNGIMEKQTLSSQLQMAGAKVDLARSGDDLVKQCSEQQYDFVILDIQDPNKNAIMILEDKNFTYPKEKVIVLMPAVHRESDVEKCHQLGVYNLVYKPFSLNKFLESTYKLEEVPKETLSQGEELSILVVDDDEENRELIRAYLANLPFQMEFAENGMQAIEKSDSDNFDMILMDIEMPELNGYDTAVRILKSPHQRKLKILGLSANAFAENLNKAEECGFSGYITKPIRKEKLVKAITECYHNDQFYKM